MDPLDLEIKEEEPGCFGTYNRENDDCWDCAELTACKMSLMKDRIFQGFEDLR